MFIFKSNWWVNYQEWYSWSRNNNPRDLCYQCSKHGIDCLLGKLRIKYFDNETHFPGKIKLISSLIQINALFKNDDKIKVRGCNKIIHRDMRIPVDINQTN